MGANGEMDAQHDAGLSGKQNEGREWVKSHFMPWA